MSAKTKTIVVLGAVGAGKTVFWSVLSRRYMDVLQPSNAQAWDFCQKNNDLLESGNWPPATNPVDKKELLWWKFKTRDGCMHDVINCDVSGEEVLDCLNQQIQLPSGDSNANFEKNVREEALLLDSLLKKASGVFFLMDLTDDVNKGENSLQEKLVSIVLNYKNKFKFAWPVSFWVTKFFTYGKREEELNDLLFRRYYIRILKFWGVLPEFFFIDSVADTEFNQEKGSLVPKKNFKSHGLEKVVKKMENIFCEGWLSRLLIRFLF